MEERYQDREFEQFIKKNADQYRMFPSENVWNGIHNTLHAKRRWYGIGLALLLLTTGVVTWLMLPTTTTKKQTTTTKTTIAAITTPEEKGIQSDILVIPAKNKNGLDSKENRSDKLQPTVFFTIPQDEPWNSRTDDKASETETVFAVSNINSAGEPASTFAFSQKNNLSELKTRQLFIESNQKIANNPSEIIKQPSADIIKDYEIPADYTAVNNESTSLLQQDIYPLTIESVVNSYKSGRKKIAWQFYLAPTISYRSLKENMNYIRAARSNGTIPTTVLISYDDVNNVVTHKPDVGFELGFNGAYPVTKNFSFTTGLQFNVSKYDILAFNNYQSEVATIALNSGNGTNSVSAITSYRSYGSNTRTNWLHNLYISASLPVGAEIKFNSKKKSYIGAAGTLQPTYVLANRAYLISTDFKNYAEVPSLTRRWNLNTAFEIFAGYSTPKLDWKIGPQVRYQTLSSFQDKYPVREHLFDFGLKLGISLK